MKNKYTLILFFSILSIIFIMNIDDSSKKINKTKIDTTSKPIQDAHGIKSSIPLKQSTPLIKASVDKPKEETVSNSKVKERIITHFDQEFGSDIFTDVKIIGDKNFNNEMVKVVRISHKKQSGIQSSYLASVKGENGKIVKSCSKTKFEKFRNGPDDFLGFTLPGSKSN